MNPTETVLFSSIGPGGTLRVVVLDPTLPGRSPRQAAIQFVPRKGDTRKVLIHSSEIESVIDALTEAASLMRSVPGRRYLPEPSARPVAWGAK